jgi:hypothetical protein
MRKTTLLLMALLCFEEAHAQATQESLDTEINQLLPSNDSNEVTAANVRQVLTDMTAAIFSTQSSWSIGGANPFAPPTQNAPVTATIAVGGAYSDSSAGSIYQVSSWLTQAGLRPAVSVFGQAQATGASSVWGGNFVAYANASGSFAQGVEVDCGTASGAMALAYCISVNAGGTTGSNQNLGLQFSSLGAGATFYDAIAFLAYGTLQPFTNALIATGGSNTITPNYGINFNSAAFQIAAIETPGFYVDPKGNVGTLVTGATGVHTIGRGDNPGAGNQLSAVNFQANNAAGTAKLFGQVSAWDDAATAGSEAGHICLGSIQSGTLGNVLCAGAGIAIGSYAGTATAPSGGLIVSGAVGIGTTSPGSAALAVVGLLSTTVNGVTGAPAASGDALILQNLTAATSGSTTQNSPNLHLVGQAWNTGASTAQVADWLIANVTASGNPVTSKLYLSAQINGGGYGAPFTFSNAGVLTAGISGTSAGEFCAVNVTSGSICLSPPAGALGTVTLTLPDTTSTLACLACTETWTATQTFSSSGNTALDIVSSTTTQNQGPGFLLYNTNSSMGNQAGVLVFTQINNSGATQGAFNIDQVNYQGNYVQTLVSYNMANNAWGFYTAGNLSFVIGSGGPLTLYGQPTTGSITYAVCAASGANGTGGGAVILDTSSTVCGLSTMLAKENIVAFTDTGRARLLGLVPQGHAYRIAPSDTSIDPLAMVNRLVPVAFNFERNDADPEERFRRQFGFTAQDACDIDERICARFSDGSPRTFNVNAVLALAIGAVQQIDSRVDETDRRIAGLEADIAKLKAANDNLEACMRSVRCRLAGIKLTAGRSP